MELKKGVRLSYLVPELTENKLKYYTYKGSITTPPCYESVRWFVMKSPIAITKQQVGLTGFSAISSNRKI